MDKGLELAGLLGQLCSSQSVLSEDSMIASQRKQLEAKIAGLNQQLKALQTTCPHTNATKTPKSDTGNWCKADDAYWYEYKCPDCGRFWTTPQR
jgi:transposase-like protein